MDKDKLIKKLKRARVLVTDSHLSRAFPAYLSLDELDLILTSLTAPVDGKEGLTFDELLKACSNGLPTVTYNGNIGRVTTIKDNDKYKGCAVRFGNNYDEWFWDSPETDKRSKYMRDLILTKTPDAG